jgi:hypothetical protein
MRFEFHDEGHVVGAAQWEGPGQVSFEVTDPAEGRFLAEYFAGEAVYLSSVFEPDGEPMAVRRRDWTPWEFEKACRALAHARGYRVVRTPSGPVEARTSRGRPARGRTA